MKEENKCEIKIFGFRDNPITFENVSYVTTKAIFNLIINELQMNYDRKEMVNNENT